MIKGYSDFVQVRAGQGTDKNKVYVRGYASMKNKPDIYNYLKLPNGKSRTFKSLFTEKCIKDVKKQLENKAIFVDGLHETATNMGIMGLAKKYNFKEDDLHDVQAALKMKRFPLAKLVDFDIDEKGLLIGTETNPNFAKVDTEHKNYYEAVTGSLMDGYLKGYSWNFDIPEGGVISEVDNTGNQMDYINKIDVYGVSYTDNQALPENEFTDVCMRSLGNFIKVRNMTEQNETNETKETPAPQQAAPKEEQKQTLDVAKEVEKQVQVELAKRDKAVEQKTIEQERDDYKKQLDEIQTKRDTPKVEPNGQPQSTVPQEDKYHDPVNPEDKPPEQSVDDGMNALKEIKEPYDSYMDEIKRPTSENEVGIRKVYSQQPYNTYGKVLELQREFQLHKRQLPGEDYTTYVQRQAILNSKQADMSVKHTKQI